jgi:formylglycine-generating enzyme required for sulfatase activity
MTSQCKRIVAAILAVWMPFLSVGNGIAQERASVPGAEAEHAAKKAAGEIYGGRFALAKTADEKTALAEEIIAAGLKFQAGSADQYVLLNIGREIAAGVGDARIALSAAQELAQRFDLPGLALEANTLLTTARWARITPQRTALAEVAGEVVGKLVEAHEYERAIQLCEAAQKAAEQAREFRQARDFSNWLPELRTAQQQFQQYRDALAVLDDDPVEPEANLAAGRYLCFVRGDWERGVAMLALGSDESLKNVAVMELQGAETAEEQAAIADAWWDVAEAREGQERDVLRLRAGSWYRRAAPQLADLAGLRIKQRLEEIGKLDLETPAAPTNPDSSAPPLAVAPFDERTAKRHQAAWARHLGVPVVWKDSIGMSFVLIPPGEFNMGSTQEEVAKLLEEAKTNNQPSGHSVSSESPKRRVRITRPYYLGIFEVTQAEYERVMGNNPSQFKGNPTRPVERVSWLDATEFSRRMGGRIEEKKLGALYRLPTEAEWEFACRAGAVTRYGFGDSLENLSRYGWWKQNSGKSTQGVGQLRPNAFGLFDMHGNAWEWCQDWFGSYESAVMDAPTGPPSGSRRVLRGGSWHNFAGYCRSANRDQGTPSYRGHQRALGFRVVLVFDGLSGR